MITPPYRFDTSSIWRKILKGAFGLNALLVVGILFTLLVSREWTTALGLVLLELVVLGFTRVFVNAQQGSVGTLSSDRVVIEPNILLGIELPGPKGTYTLDSFSAVRVEFRSGAGSPDVQDTGPHELVWLVGKLGTPNVVLARTNDRAGLTVGRELGTLLGLPVEETGAPKRYDSSRLHRPIVELLRTSDAGRSREGSAEAQCSRRLPTRSLPRPLLVAAARRDDENARRRGTQVPGDGKPLDPTIAVIMVPSPISASWWGGEREQVA